MKKIEFAPNLLTNFFNLKVREACKSCKRYGKKATCPPHIDSLDYYKNLLPQYEYGILIIEEFLIDDLNNWQWLGENSSLFILNQLWSLRQELLDKGHFPIIFGAGSCKICKECSFPCKMPDKSAIPIEGTGLDIIGLISYLTDIKLVFPVKDKFYRIGMILWD
jgi:predicted metal-binding protein